ncbi:hypothetical protein DMO24_11750 [Modestobacter versicolor]|uniref:Uncharacterized protein n=1 Tax=Modestobacter versicolor TaxID=429133 RepID=A0A323VNP5_9ACTN|nr:hypothetical protein [Modestobacter versicolor]PZA21168.1 hypothetical protein DMO24_11750 [Modestobacter versicolor]
MEMIIVADAAQAAGEVVGRLLVPAIGVLLIVLGNRKRSAARRSPAPQSTGKGLRVTGWVIVVLSVLSILANAGANA